MTATHSKPLEKPALWLAPAPVHFDSAWPWWAKLGVGLILLAITLTLLDGPIAHWAIKTDPLARERIGGDAFRELAMLEQFGQWTCSILILLAVLLIDRQGRRRALAMGLGCLLTVLVCYLLKDLFGRPRPDTLAEAQPWTFLGPAVGFAQGSKYGSFPSAHTTGAFALASALSWFYPQGRALFVTLACVTAGQRVLHHAHYLSDVVAGIILSVGITRLSLMANLAGRLIAAMPAVWQAWWLAETSPPLRHVPPRDEASDENVR